MIHVMFVYERVFTAGRKKNENLTQVEQSHRLNNGDSVPAEVQPFQARLIFEGALGQKVCKETLFRKKTKFKLY
jgi:hypothetical protein